MSKFEDFGRVHRLEGSRPTIAAKEVAWQDNKVHNIRKQKTIRALPTNTQASKQNMNLPTPFQTLLSLEGDNEMNMRERVFQR